MKLVLTLMVRDEADIIGVMIQHHLDQGVDLIIATDNGSVDGTREILEGYAERGLVDLRHDPVHRKQQGRVVTQMARDAATLHSADWVINADADEFWVPVDSSKTLKEAFSGIDPAIQSFTVDVVDMTGPPASEGTGLQRLVYQDHRSIPELNAVGLHAPSTHDAAHIADPEIEVVQGNHLVSLASLGRPEPQNEVEVLHFPWRSWKQFATKVGNAGRAYLESPELTPSPNHHGMRDYGRLVGGTLYFSYLARHPTPREIEAGIADGTFVEDRRIALAHESPVPDRPIDIAEGKDDVAAGRTIAGLDLELTTTRETVTLVEAQVTSLGEELAAAQADAEEKSRLIGELHAQVAQEQTLVHSLQSRKVVRAVDGAARIVARPKRVVGRLSRDIREKARERGWHRQLVRAARGGYRLETLHGSPSHGAIPVVMCLWNRRERFAEVLAELDAQTTDAPIRLMLWNNNPADDRFYRDAIAAFERTGALASIEYVSSPMNYGGIARFFLTRHLRSTGVGHAVLLDDDEVIPVDFIDTMRAAAADRSIAGYWAFTIVGSYWERKPTPDGEVADYVGTGGCILDLSITDDLRFFTELPRRYAFLEDLWMSWYAQRLGWSVRKVDTDIHFVLEESNQFHTLVTLKEEFYRYLQERTV